jgi:hypothetical protein
MVGLDMCEGHPAAQVDFMCYRTRTPKAGQL